MRNSTPSWPAHASDLGRIHGPFGRRFPGFPDGMAGYFAPILAAAGVVQRGSYALGDIITGVVRRDIPGGAGSGEPCID